MRPLVTPCLLCLIGVVLGFPYTASSQHAHAPSQPRDATRSPRLLERAWNRMNQIVWASETNSDKLMTEFGSPIVQQQRAKYHQSVVLRFTFTSEADATTLLQAANAYVLDVWEVTATWADIRISKQELPKFFEFLPRTFNYSYTTLLDSHDLAEAIDQTLPQMPTMDGGRRYYDSFEPAALRVLQNDAFFQDYQPLSVIYPWMRLLSSLFSTHVKMINIGVTYEGRDIPALRVGVPPIEDGEPVAPRKTIIISGGLHAREWISTTTVNYIAYHLITSFGKSFDVDDLLRTFDWIFIPTLNPDGYEYTWTHDRLWRKNRQDPSGDFCHGIDLDRTWDFKWDGAEARGNPCSETFAGNYPFQGVESRRFAEWAKNETEDNKTDFVGFLDLHSYSQQILYPFSYTCGVTPPTLEDLEELAHGLAKAIRVQGHKNYKVTSACKGNVDLLSTQDRLRTQTQSGGGSALDWFYHEMLVRHSYQIKLRDTGSYGFLLPKQYIVPTGSEILQAVLSFGKSLARGRD